MTTARTELPVKRLTYHHGDLRRTLIDTAILMIEESGVESLSVRAVALRAGVAPSAPFRHFANKRALLTAIAEEAMDRLEEAIDGEIALADDCPVSRFAAIGEAFLKWALTHPTHFQIISMRAVIDFEQSGLASRNAKIRDMMVAYLTSAREQGLLRGEPWTIALTGRALAYGLARMYLDGQFPSWSIDTRDPLAASISLLRNFIELQRQAPEG